MCHLLIRTHRKSYFNIIIIVYIIWTTRVYVIYKLPADIYGGYNFQTCRQIFLQLNYILRQLFSKIQLVYGVSTRMHSYKCVTYSIFTLKTSL